MSNELLALCDYTMLDSEGDVEGFIEDASKHGNIFKDLSKKHTRKYFFTFH